MGYFDDLKPARPEPRLVAVPSLDNAEGATKYALAALRSEAELVAGAAEGTRNATLNKAWFNMGRHVGAGNIDAGTVRATLADAARSAGLPTHEVEVVLRDGPTSALEAGRDVPRHPVPLEPLPSVTLLPAATQADDDEAPDIGEIVRKRFPLLDFAHLLSTDDDGEEWILEPILPARRLVALYSAPKAGKSLLMLEIAVGVTLGTPVLGTTPEPRKVLYVDFENDPRGDIKRRLEAMGFGPDDGERLNEGLCYLSFPTIAKLDTPQGATELLAAVQEYDCEVVVIDTVSRAVGGEENDNDTWLSFYRHTGLALKQAGVACIRLDHSGKDVEKGMRGGSAKYGDVDAVWKLAAESETVLNLVCTDHRMMVHEDRLTLVRDSDPVLRHRVIGDRMVALDAREAEVDKALDALGLPATVGNRVAKKALREAGYSFSNPAIEKAIRARKLNLEARSRGTSGERSPASDSPSPSPASLKGAGTGNVGGFPGNTDEDDAPKPMFQVACKSCYAPMDRDESYRHAGRCAKCRAKAGEIEGDPA